ncbi:MAG: LolA-like outer membrane lipoprotein chaperone, partial [Campylobacterota bacterium]|nr:LolA-like outer membrane lipoprotein chaperone [Campylobacterota bacterium]
IYIKQPHKLVWKYDVPIEKLVYINNKIVTIIEPDLEQAIISRLEQEINILKLLKDAVKVKKNIYKSNLNNRDYLIQIIDNKLTQIKYKDEIDNKITIDFKNIKQNQDLPENIFKFHIPFEFDIIRK